MIYVAVFFLVFGVSTLCAQPQIDTRKELAAAQQWLADGEYQQAYEAFHFHAQEKQNPLAQFTLGLFYQQGWGIEVDLKKACRWFESAAEGGIPTANHLFAQCLQNGTHQPADFTSAIHWYQNAADLGHIISWCSIAELTLQGKGIPQNPHKALEQCRQAALTGSTPAQIQMGKFYLHGDTSIQDPRQAAVWFSYAANSGSLEACYHLGVINLNDFNDVTRALNWFETAASQGYLSAYFPTARLYFNAPVSDETKLPTAANLAKAYLWLSATRQLSKDEKELRDTERMLKKIEQIMPESWKKDLDQKVFEHLSAFHQN
ncbi:hypothetical protein SAMN05216302_102231 [Nitrosomonas aestuarii]|uniref:TPR repeat n=1 Tax=Nitrosomonas aestuarii TaxID=52441 RepID=A0A1I4DRB9_9PROT|nr:hypothetical protein SAMN05216302_102231 [Nitrosomonas aestuarii]